MADGFVEHVQIDLTDFRNLPCKFTWLYQLHSKENEEAVNILEKQFYQFGFPGIFYILTMEKNLRAKRCQNSANNIR